MSNWKHAGTFHSVDTVLYKITELKAQGYKENQINGVSGIEDTLTMLHGKTRIELQGGNGEDHVLGVFARMGFSGQAAKEYFHEVKDGGVALFVEDLLPHSNDVDMEMDSDAERRLSGELLNGQDEQEQILENVDTVPRIDTRNL